MKAGYWMSRIMRMMILLTIFVTLLLGVVLFVAGHSSYLAKRLFAQIAPQYQLHYQRIEGDLYNGITLKEVSFKNRSLARKITLHYNPNALLHQELQVTRLEVEDADVDVIKAFVATLQEEGAQSDTRSKDESGDVGLHFKVNDIALSTLPFEEHGIHFDSIDLTAKSLYIDLYHNEMEIEGLENSIRSGFGTVKIVGSLKKRVLHIAHLSLRDLDTEAIEQQIAGIDHGATSEHNRTESGESVMLPFDEVVVEQAALRIKPTHYHDIAVDRISLDAEALDIMLKPAPFAKSGRFALGVTTDLAEGSVHGRLKESRVTGELIAKPKKALYQKYALPLRPEAIQKISADFNASRERIAAVISTEAKALLAAKKGGFNLDIDRFDTDLVYHIPEGLLTAKSRAVVDTPYAKALHIDNTLRYDGNLSYDGTLGTKSLEGLDPALQKLLKGAKLHYQGGTQALHAILENSALKATFATTDFAKGALHMENKRVIEVSSLVELPGELNGSAVQRLQLDASVDLKAPMQTVPHIVLVSDLLHADINGSNREGLKLSGKLWVPKDSRLRKYQPRIQWDKIMPLRIDGRLQKKRAVLTIASRSLQSRAEYNMTSGDIEAKIGVDGLNMKIKGKPKARLVAAAQINTGILAGTLGRLYRFETPLPPLEGDIALEGTMTGMKNLSMKLTSSKLRYRPKRGEGIDINNIALALDTNGTAFTIPSYQLEYKKQRFFATRSSRVILKGSQVTLPEFWLNDSLKISGAYDLKKREGALRAKGDRFHIKDEMADLYAGVDIESTFKGPDTTVQGKVVVLGGTVSVDTESKSFASDSDIVILQEMKQKKESPFMQHLSMLVKIETQQPIILRQNDLYARLKPDLTLFKDPDDRQILYLGSIVLQEGGYYRFKEKKFILKKSYIYFSGDLHKPFLDIKATYQSLNYLITITVSGTPAAPNIDFRSSPSLTREQILSVILFDSEEGGDTHSGDEMMRMMGGVMAKAALSDLGVQIDHLVFGENGTIEVGKKLTRKITVIYINGEEPKIKFKIRHGRHTESVIGASQKSESYDMIYKGDF